MDKKQKQIDSENNGLLENAKEDMVNVDSIKERIGKIEKELVAIDKKVEKLHSDMEKYAGPEEESGSFNHVRKIQKENAAFGKAEQKPEIVEQAVRELKDSYLIKKEELEGRVEKIKSDIENVAKDRDDVKNVTKSDLSKIDGDIERIREDVVLFKENLADLHIQAQESIEQFEQIHGVIDNVAVAKNLGAAAANVPDKGGAESKLRFFNRKIKEAQENKNTKMEKHYQEEKASVVAEIKKKEQENKAKKKKQEADEKKEFGEESRKEIERITEAFVKSVNDLGDSGEPIKETTIKNAIKRDILKSIQGGSFSSVAKIELNKIKDGYEMGDDLKKAIEDKNKERESKKKAKEKGSTKPKVSLAGNGLQGAEKDDAGKEFLIEKVKDLFEKSKKDIENGKFQDKGKDTKAPTLTIKKFQSGYGKEFGKLSQNEQGDIEALLVKYNADLELIFKAKMVEIEAAKKSAKETAEEAEKGRLGEYFGHIDKSKRKESLKYLEEIAIMDKKLSDAVSSMPDDDNRAEIKNFINDYTEEKGFKKEELDKYVNQKKFLELTKILFAEVENRIKALDNKQVDQEVFVPEDDNETPESESVNEERIGAGGEKDEKKGDLSEVPVGAVSELDELSQKKEKIKNGIASGSGGMYFSASKLKGLEKIDEQIADLKKRKELEDLHAQKNKLEQELGDGMGGMNVRKLRKLEAVKKQIELLEAGVGSEKDEEDDVGNFEHDMPDYDEEVSESESVNEERIGAGGELQKLRIEREKIENEIKAGMVGMRITELHNKLDDINKQIEKMERGEEISAEEKQQFQKEVEQMPAKERERLGLGLRNMGFFARELKSKALAGLCKLAADGVDRFYGEDQQKMQIEDRGVFIRFAKSLEGEFKNDATSARKQIEDSNKKVKAMQQVQNVSTITGGALKWGRTAADVAGWTIGSPLRYITIGAQVFSKVIGNAKETRLINKKVINKTRIEDIDEAMDEAWNLYGQAKIQATKDGVVSGEILNKVYLENLPKDLLKRLENTEPGSTVGIIQTLLKKDIEWAIKHGKITKNSFELFLKDCDRLVSHYGEIDALALGARYAQTAGKAVIAGVALESFALLMQRAPEIVRNAGSMLHELDQIWEGKESELPKGAQMPETGSVVPGIEDEIGAPQEQGFGYQGGKSIWKEAEKQLEARYKMDGGDERSMEVLKTFNVDKIKDIIAENPIGYGLSETDNLAELSEDKLQNINWNLVFDNLKAENAFVSELDAATGESILSNNETLRTFFAEHPDAPRTSENYENILQGRGITGEILEQKAEGNGFKFDWKVKAGAGGLENIAPIEFDNGYGLRIEAIDEKADWNADQIRITDQQGRVLDVIKYDDGIGVEENIKNAKVEALHIINWSKADFENIVGRPNFEFVGGKQAVMNGMISGSARISIEDAERAGINVFGRAGLSSVDTIKLNAWMENIKSLDTPERAKLFFDLSEETGVDFKSSGFKSAFEKMPDDFTMDQSVGYMKIFAGGDVKEGVVDLLGVEGAHVEKVVMNNDVIEIKNLNYKGKVMDVFVSKDGKIGIESGNKINLGIKKEVVFGWPPLKAVPEYEINGDSIAMIRERMKAVLNLKFNEEVQEIVQPEAGVQMDRASVGQPSVEKVVEDDIVSEISESKSSFDEAAAGRSPEQEENVSSDALGADIEVGTDTPINKEIKIDSPNISKLGNSWLERGATSESLRRLSEEPARGGRWQSLTTKDGKNITVSGGFEAKMAAKYALKKMKGN